MSLPAAAVAYFVMFALSALFDRYRGVFEFPKPGPGFMPAMAADAAIGAAAGLLGVILSVAAVRSIAAFRRISEDLAAFLGRLTVQEAFLLAAFSAAGEEALFRGVIQGELGIVAASLLFGALHVGPGARFLPWTAFAVVVGFGLGGVYAWRVNLIAPMIAHFVINFVNLLWLPRQAERHRASSSGKEG